MAKKIVKKISKKPVAKKTATKKTKPVNKLLPLEQVNLKEGIDVAVVGATGMIGEAVLEILAERDFPVKNIYALASERSAGDSVVFKGKTIAIELVDTFDFAKTQLAFFVASGECAEKHVPRATKAGCVVIDNSSTFRYDEDVPLIVPEVNPEALKNFRKRLIIANPNCTTVQIVVAIKPIYDAVGIKRMNVATYQSVAGAGRPGIEELAQQAADLLNGQGLTSKVFPAQIAFNVIPQIDRFEKNGYTFEEMKVVWETQKILGDKKILVNPTAVRVPVFFGHSAALHLETKQAITAAKAKKLLSKAPGVQLIAEDADAPTPVGNAAHEDSVFVGRVRQDISSAAGIDLWVVADNIRKGGALNAVQIAELILASWKI